MDSERIRLAMQRSGRLSDASFELLSKCGLHIARSRTELFCRVEELPIIEPLVLLDDSPIEKGDDCQAAPEDKSSSLSEKPEHLCQSLGCCRTSQTGS